MVPDEIGVVQPPTCWVTAPTPLASSANSSAVTSRKKLAVTTGDSGSWPEVPSRASRRAASRRAASRARPPAAIAAKGSAIASGPVIGTALIEHWQTPGPSWTARTPVVTQTRGECSKNTAGEAAGTDGRRQQPGAASTRP